MNEITEIAKRRYEVKLKALKEDLAVLGPRVEAARDLGDLSENEEYHSSLAEFAQKTSEAARIEHILATSEVKTSYSTNISYGTLIEIELKTPNGWKNLGLKLFDETDGSTISGTITPASNLGREMEGSVGGEFVVQSVQGTDLVYRATIQPASRLDEYLELYPPDPTRILDRIFAG